MRSIKFNLLLLILISSTFLVAQDSNNTETDPVNITAQAVINRYIAAIGGVDNFTNITDRTTILHGTAMGQNISIIIKQKAPNMLYQELKVGEMTQKMYFDGTNGLMVIGENKTKIKGKELERLKTDATIHLLLEPEKYGVKTELAGQDSVDSVECYKVRMTLPSGIRWFQYYDTNSGLRVKEVKEIQTEQGLFEQETLYSDYRKVDGVKFPFTINQSLGIQQIDLEVSSIKLNEGIEDSVFVLPE